MSPNAVQQQRAAMVHRIEHYHGLTGASRVLEAMAQLPRHLFVPLQERAHAHGDHPIPVGYGQTISQPYMVAFMTAAAELCPADRVLEVGTGSAYQAAVLAAMGAEVFSIEIVPELHHRASRLLRRLGMRRVHMRLGDGALGWASAAPFAAILVTAAAPQVPQALLEQLAEGGRLIIPVGENQGPQHLQILRRQGGSTVAETVLPVRFVPLTGVAEESP